MCWLLLLVIDAEGERLPEILQNVSFPLRVEELGDILVMALLETCPMPCHI